MNFEDKVIPVHNAVKPDSLNPILQQLISELDAYFAGQQKSFSVPLDPEGTDFQKKVWNAVVEIPYGQAVSYSRLAGNLHQSGAVRAVANANARNPILILIPCHRIVGTGGHLTGYAAGLPRKKFLLELEGALQPARQLSLQF